jgi:hypothetical protein
MKLSRLILSGALLVSLVGLAYVAQKIESAGMKMVTAGEKFVSTLTKKQKAKAVFDFDSKERTNWHFIPMQDDKKRSTRKGLPLQDMNEDQRKAALALLEAGTSDSGNKKALTIMSLEAILKDQEKGGAIVRNSNWYFFSIFGTPSKTSKWGWRVEGHHLSLNFVVDNGKITAATPNFFGANPAVVQTGKRKGLRTLAGADGLARKLFKSLNEDQQKIAFQKKLFPEIRQGDADPGVGEPKGLAAGKLTEKQRGILMELLEHYTNRNPADVAAAEMKKIKDADITKIHFAYAGGLEPGQRHTYRVQGPTFVIEFLNEQSDSAGNRANHIHSALRDPKGDFGVEKK